MMDSQHTALDGVLDMQAFFARASRLLAGASAGGYHVVRFDVQDFHVFNMQFGLEEGDRLLHAIGKCLGEVVDPHTEACGRLYADVFVACLAGGDDRVDEFCSSVMYRMNTFREGYHPEVFFGVCAVQKADEPVHVLCDRAHHAQKTVKGSDLSHIGHFDATMLAHLENERFVREEMHDALDMGQFILYLQPKVQISTGNIVGAEALARWQHPTRGLVSPGLFVPVFERTGFVLRFDEYIWEETCKILRHWLDKGYRPTPVSINVSRMHFNDDSFSMKLRELVDSYDLPHDLLELELTESAFFENEKRLVRMMQDLSADGFVFSMDDFGTGYSSLKTLRSLPFQIVKLDRAFISDGADNARGQVVARHTVAMAHDLGMKIIAEGVETVEQARFLLEIDCNMAQGFYYSKPVDVAEFEVTSFVHEKSFWVHPLLQEQARKMGLPCGESAPSIIF